MDLGEHLPASGGGVVQQRQIAAPHFRRAAAGEQAPGDRHAGFNGQRLQALVVVVDALRIPPHGLAGDLEQASAGAAHRANDGSHFVPGRHPAGDGLAIRRLVVGRARGGEAHRPGAYRFRGEARHAAHFLRARFVRERAWPHHVGAQGAVAEVAGVVDALGQRVHRVQVLGKALPAPANAGQHRFPGDVLGAFEIAKHQIRFLLPAGRQGEAAVAHDDAGDAVVAGAGAEGIPEHLRIHVRMPVDEAGRHHMAFRIHRGAGGFGEAPDVHDAPAAYANVRPDARRPAAVHHGAALNRQVVSHRPLPLWQIRPIEVPLPCLTIHPIRTCHAPANGSP